mgnify:FL=1|tara:strand:- start:1385 stop:1594 length:210 start_codon:yes stop_codon:yes gene_type:complete
MKPKFKPANDKQIKTLSDSVASLEHSTMVLAFELQEERNKQALSFMVLAVLQSCADLMKTMGEIYDEDE